MINLPLFKPAPNNALHRTGLALRARPSLASLGAGERERWATTERGAR
jgi:hypothetical protein